MDKNEYRAKLDEINDLVDRQDYKGALKIVDTIDWRRVRSARTLCMVGEIYEANKRYSESQKLLLLARQRAPIGKTVLYRLVELSIKMGKFDEAVDYYKQFVEISPNDNSRYILKYKIYRAKRSSIEEQISILQEYKEREYTERWAYELARLYAKAGMREACVEECDDLILWFSEGKYVMKAMELKMKYAPLTASQQEKYDKRFKNAPSVKAAATASAVTAATAAAAKIVGNAGVSEVSFQSGDKEIEDILNSLTAGDSGNLSAFNPELEAPENLQDKVAQGIRDVFQGRVSIAEDEEAAAAQEPSESISPEEKGYVIKDLEPEDLHKTTEFKPFHKPGAMTMEVRAEAPKSKMFRAEDLNADEFKADITERELDLDALLAETANELAQAVAEETGNNAETEPEMTQESAGVQEPAEEENAPEKSAEEPVEESAQEAETEPELVAPAAARAALVAENLSAAFAPKVAEFEALAGGNPAASEVQIPEVKTEPVESEAQMPEVEAEPVASEVQTPEVKAEPMAAEMQTPEVKAEPVAAAGMQTPEVEAEPVAAAGMQTSEVEAEPVAAAGMQTPEVEAKPEPATAEVQTPEVEAKPVVSEMQMPEVEAEPVAAAGMQIPEVEIEPVASEVQTPEVKAEPTAEYEESAKEMDIPEDATREFPVEEVKRTMEEINLSEVLEKELANTVHTEKEESHMRRFTGSVASENSRKSVAFNAAMEGLMRHHLTEEEHRRLFTYFAPIPGMTQQINEALDIAQESACEKTSKSGNIIVVGREGSGKTRLSEGLIKALCKERQMEGAKVAYITAEQLNKKDPVAVVGKLSGGFLVVENAGALDSEIVENMSKAMEFKTNRLTVILEDLKPGIRTLEEKYPEFIRKFDSRIAIPVFTNDELVSFAKTYAKELGYKIDNMAVLALYTLIGDNQNEENPVAIGMVREMMDDAIKTASRRGRRPGKKVGKRHLDESGRIMLYEKDFDI